MRRNRRLRARRMRASSDDPIFLGMAGVEPTFGRSVTLWIQRARQTSGAMAAGTIAITTAFSAPRFSMLSPEPPRKLIAN
jgi:hypothetical protein